MTFPRADALRDVARRVPADRWLVETDSPYLSPAPQRGGRNEPARVVQVLETVASGSSVAVRRGRRAGPGQCRGTLRSGSAPTGRRALTAPPQCVEIPEVSHVQPSSSPSDLAQIFEPVRDDLARVDQEFLRHVESRVELIPQIGKYLQNTGGKRVRPAVLLMAAASPGPTRATWPCCTPRSSSSSTPRPWSTTTSSTTRNSGAAASPCTRGGATTSPCCSATTSTSSRWRWR